MSIKNSNDTIGNRTHDLAACSTVSQLTEPPCDHVYVPYANTILNDGKPNSKLWMYLQIAAHLYNSFNFCSVSSRCNMMYFVICILWWCGLWHYAVWYIDTSASSACSKLVVWGSHVDETHPCSRAHSCYLPSTGHCVITQETIKEMPTATGISKFQ
jgi:hypothetical protein